MKDNSRLQGERKWGEETKGSESSSRQRSEGLGK